MPGSKGVLWLREEGISRYGMFIGADAENATTALHMRGPLHPRHASWNDLVDDPTDVPCPTELLNVGIVGVMSLPPDCAPELVPRTAEARVQWVLWALKSIPGVEMLEALARALVTIPVSDPI
jgi:hypothetical protein